MDSQAWPSHPGLLFSVGVNFVYRAVGVPRGKKAMNTKARRRARVIVVGEQGNNSLFSAATGPVLLIGNENSWAKGRRISSGKMLAAGLQVTP
jgi:hypothetical protein